MLGLCLLLTLLSVHFDKLGVLLLKRLLINVKTCGANQPTSVVSTLEMLCL